MVLKKLSVALLRGATGAERLTPTAALLEIGLLQNNKSWMKNVHEVKFVKESEPSEHKSEEILEMISNRISQRFVSSAEKTRIPTKSSCLSTKKPDTQMDPRR